MIYYYLFFINVLSFIIYGIDKYQSKNNKRRISEKTLLLFSAFGGCFGSVFAMNIFSHKTKKKKFIIVNYLLIIFYTFILLKVIIWK